jgi:hypothetical protein
MQPVDNRDTIKPATPPKTIVEVRGASGRLYGRLNRETLVIEVKRKNEPPEFIDLKPLLAKP